MGNRVSLADRVVLVTGSSRGIGQAVAVAFAGRGARVVVNSVSDVAGGESVVQEIKAAGGQAWYVQADAGEPAEVQRIFDAVERDLGPVDVLINNAGVTEGAAFLPADEKGPGAALEATKQHWLRMLNVNLLSTVLCSQRAAGPMLKRGSGVIINTASIRGFDANGREGIMAYSAAKAAVINFTRTLAKQLAPNVRVNAVAPGFVATSYMDRVDDQMKAGWLDGIPLHRFISPAEAAEAYVFLAEAVTATGTILTLDAGFTLGRG
jgi:3-oxoacyl-[acyl-carrier protein] reductase